MRSRRLAVARPGANRRVTVDQTRQMERVLFSKGRVLRRQTVSRQSGGEVETETKRRSKGKRQFFDRSTFPRLTGASAHSITRARMSESYQHVVKGGLKLKGGVPAAGGVKKKKKKKDKH